jgi:hypothetical protein
MDAGVGKFSEAQSPVALIAHIVSAPGEPLIGCLAISVEIAVNRRLITAPANFRHVFSAVFLNDSQAASGLWC